MFKRPVLRFAVQKGLKWFAGASHIRKIGAGLAQLQTANGRIRPSQIAPNDQQEPAQDTYKPQKCGLRWYVQGKNSKCWSEQIEKYGADIYQAHNRDQDIALPWFVHENHQADGDQQKKTLEGGQKVYAIGVAHFHNAEAEAQSRPQQSTGAEVCDQPVMHVKVGLSCFTVRAGPSFFLVQVWVKLLSAVTTRYFDFRL